MKRPNQPVTFVLGILVGVAVVNVANRLSPTSTAELIQSEFIVGHCAEQGLETRVTVADDALVEWGCVEGRASN